MTNHEAATQKLDGSGRERPRALDSAAWRQVIVDAGYVLVAGPLGLGYLFLFQTGLALDLPLLALRLLLAATRGLLLTAGRLVRWLLRSLRWVFFSLPRAGVVTLMHPRRTLKSMRCRARPSLQGRSRGDRLLDALAAPLKQLSRQVAPERWLFLPAIWWRVALWERRHTMRWLGIDLPPLEPPQFKPDGRAVIRYHLPLTSLVYLVAKAFLGAVALGLILFVSAIWIQLPDIGDAGVLIALGAVVVLPVAVIYALHMLARGWGRLAQRAFSPSATIRRLRAAEAVAAQERAKAERAEQRRRDLVINVGHELRTPAASILGHVESVLLALDTPDGQMSPETLRRYLGIVQREAERLSSLVDDLLAVARAERAELQLVLAPIDAAEVIGEVYEALAPLARRVRQVMLVHEAQPGLPPLLADRQRLSQVLLNLVRNAITYTPPGGIVSIALRRADGERLRITVADTGAGIAPADLERVFERFYRADASRARASGGVGLGLSIARDLVEAMGGTLTAESIVGEGSCFHVSLPVAPDSEATMNVGSDGHPSPEE